MRTTPNNITELKDNEVFVFGSNEVGIHGAGAAALAYKKFGAEYLNGVGAMGKSYAIPTKDKKIETLSIGEIEHYVNQFIDHAVNWNDSIFLVTEIGCGLAGYYPEDIAPLFKEAINIENIYLPERFWNILKK